MKKILIVEDDISIADIEKDYLEIMGQDIKKLEFANYKF